MPKNNKQSQPLCCFPEGTRVTVADLDGCPKARAKLYAMGLTPGTEMEVVQSGNGPCRLRVRGTDLVLGHGMSQKILACPKACPSDDLGKAG